MNDPAWGEWSAYLDAVDAAVSAVAIAVAAGEPPVWPATLDQPARPLPAPLQARREASIRALNAVVDVTRAARDGVSAEIGQLARRSVVRDTTSAATLGGSFDSCG